MKYLYKYPQAAYPYVDIIENNRRRNRYELEYELLDTGIFDGDRYFDVTAISLSKISVFAKQTLERVPPREGVGGDNSNTGSDVTW
jgi:hypothetical protein